MTFKLFNSASVYDAETFLVKLIRKTMKKLVAMMVIILFTAGMIFAQEERGGGERPSKTAESGGNVPGGNRPPMNPEEMLKRQNQRLVDELKLNKDQETKVLAINKKYMDKNSGNWEKMRDASDEERKKFRDEMRKVNEDRNKEIKALLSADQIKLFDEMQKKREEERKNRQGGGNWGSSGGQRQ
jgi:periplasmic protein CpxP/Spy